MSSDNIPGTRARRRWPRVLLGILILLVVAGVAAFELYRPAPRALRSGGEPMQAIVYHEYGPPQVLRLEVIDRPVPKDNQVLLEVHASSVNPLDWHYMRGDPYVIRLDEGLHQPEDPQLGTDVAGVVVGVGRSVTRFKLGDEVYGVAAGAFAEYARASEKRIALKPAALTFEQAAAMPIAAITALQALRDTGKIKVGQKVLINGASGGVGTFAVQIAKSYGADVTAVCSTRNVELVRFLGADHVIDYSKEDFTRGDARYEVILDTVGNRSLSDLRRVLTPKGIYIGIGGGSPADGGLIGPLKGMLKELVVAPFVSQDLTTMMAEITSADLAVLNGLVEAKKLTPVIDRTYPLKDVPEAVRYLELGHARGKVSISVAAKQAQPAMQ